ncbi:MAG: YifB family Mg chelatase-like AAA ATPase [Myxococcota bacterium]
MPSATRSVAITGLQAHLIQVEVDCGRGLPSFHLVGLPEAAVRESRVRVRSALRRLECDVNEHALTINLAPAYLRKSGSAFDLAMAVGILDAVGMLSPKRGELSEWVMLGELSLDGAVRPVRGLLPSLLGVHRAGLSRVIVPRGNAAEASSIDRLEAYVADDLASVVAFMAGRAELERASASDPTDAGPPEPDDVDLAEVRGQETARRGLEIAAAGDHNLLMVGPPGSGKTMLARRLPTLLPPLTDDEAIEVTSIHSVAGLLCARDGVVRRRPFRAPHHTVSAAGLMGGGTPPRPGEVSLAHRGVLFLDELAEYRRHVIEGLRQPLEDGEVTIARAHARATFPAQPILCAAVNPCPCGFFGVDRDRCQCRRDAIQQYRSRLSGPLLDRIDLHVHLPPVRIAELRGPAEAGESSAAVRERVVRARTIQRDRFVRGATRHPSNSQLRMDELEAIADLSRPAHRLLERAADHFGLSARSYGKLRRVARTIADLAASDAVRETHVAEALTLRQASSSIPRRAART